MPEKAKIPVYTNDYQYAQENRDYDEWRASNKANKECSAALDKAINENYTYENYHLDTNAVINSVYEEFGKERTDYILAAHIVNHDWDGRFSNGVKEWAKDKFKYLDQNYVRSELREHGLKSHSTLINGVAGTVISAEKEKRAEKAISGNEWRMYVIPDMKSWFRSDPEHPRTPIEYYRTFAEAKARFDELRSQQYNSEKSKINGFPAARLTLGIDSNLKNMAIDILQVRNDKNVLVDDFTRSNYVLNSKEAMELISQTSKEIHFDEVMCFPGPENGRQADTPEFVPFDKWDNTVLLDNTAEKMHDVIGNNDKNDAKISVKAHPYRLKEYILKETATGGTLTTGTREEVRRFCETELAASVKLPELDAMIDKAETARQNHIAEMKEKELAMESEFLESSVCMAAIYQIRNLPENRDISFMDMNYLEDNGMKPDRDRYSLVYSFEVLPEDLKDKDEFLNKVYAKFNLDHPKDFTGHSLSVSDVIAINNNGEITSHFVDSFDFTEIKGFVKERENPLKAVEDAVEQNDNSFDRIINNKLEDVEMSDAEEDRPSERKSILSFLKDTKPVSDKPEHDEAERSKFKGNEL